MNRYLLLLLSSIAFAQEVRHVVLISLDGFPAFALNDPTVPLPTLRRLMKEGASARAMEPVNPTVTWPNHTSMVTGVEPATHGVIYNGLPVRGGDGQPVRVEPWRDKSELVLAPTLYDLAHAAGLTTAEVDWVAITNAKTIHWSFFEVPRPDGVIEKEMIAAGLATADEIAGFAKLPITLRDEIWTQAALHILRRHRPRLLLFHLLNNDSVHHRYGPGNLAANTSLALLDARVDRVLQTLRETGLADRTAVFVVSDHGFKEARTIVRPNVLLKEAHLDTGAWVISEGGTAMLYATREATRTAILAGVKKLFATVRGIERIIEPEEFAAYVYPAWTPGGRMADRVLVARSGYGFDGSSQGPVETGVPASGHHGYLSSDPDMQAIFIAAGAGIRSGARLDKVRAIDVAPTLAALLGLRMDHVSGRPLSEILLEPGR
ncbi:MAG: alkaline phosphatase family protein [Candidatus Solibacter usitatus]|nr:alkaline phosphatase family protein [Candidatus Solibacter usitatus]